MSDQPTIPRFVSLKSDGISSRYAKVCGRSGRSYIVTEVPVSLLSAYHDCIAIAVVRDRIAGVWLACEGWQPEPQFCGSEFSGSGFCGAQLGVTEIDESRFGGPQVSARRNGDHGFIRGQVRWFLHFLSGSDPQITEDLRPDLSVSSFADRSVPHHQKCAA